MGEQTAAAPRAWRLSMYVVYGVSAAIAVAVIASSLRLIDDWLVPSFAGFYGGALCGIVWLVLSIVGLVRYRRTWPFVVAPVVVFGAIGALLLAGAPARAQYRMSESALRDAAAECVPATDVRIGLYRVEEVAPHNGACFFYLPGDFIDRTGLAVLPDAPAPDQYRHLGITTSRISGDVYRFTWHF